MSRIYLTSDLHLGHELVAQTRGFASTEEHDAAVVDGWESTVKENDAIYVLGDLVGNTKHTTYALDVIARLSGTKHLISGNHDMVSSIHRRGWKYLPAYLEVFASAQVMLND